ncbi:MAG: adenylate/guanylate cyclase domain-containing protein [Chloroflexota bacterium]|nr:adenylate/guanylate cyclase domain-containing protein [Chloroflexota bacterium]
MLGRLRGIVGAVLRIGARPTDTRDQRLRKGALVLISVSITLLATIWTLTYLWVGLPLAAASPLAYQLISMASLTYLARTGDYNVLRFVQITAILVLPFTLQWSLAGFDNSSAVMVWAFAGPLSALVFYGPRGALGFFAAYIVLALVSGLIDPALEGVAPPMPYELRLAFFVLNIGGVSVVTYAVLQSFVAARERAQAEAERLLHNVLPQTIAERLRAGEELIADDHSGVTVLFADVAGFTPLARRAGADRVIAILNRIFSAFDELAARHGLEKIKTIGDAYMAVAGAPVPRPDHAAAAADMALDMLAEIERCAADLGEPLQLRLGMHSGAAVAGVIGRRKFAYDLWGDAVNVASRMESHGVAGRIQVSQAVVAQLGGKYRVEERGTIDVKGVGEMRTFFLLGRAG